MAFLLLAASARDETALLLQPNPRKTEDAAAELSKLVVATQEDSQTFHCKSKRRTKRSHHHYNKISLSSSWKSYFHLPVRKANHSAFLSNSAATTWRQRRRVRKIANQVQDAVEARLRDAPFLTFCLKQDRSRQKRRSEPHHHEKDHKDDDDVSVSSSNSNSISSACVMPVVVTRDQLSVRFWLGHGGFCEVWEASVTGDVDDVAFKHLRSSLVSHSKLGHHHGHDDDGRPSSFVLGATDLRMESMYLSQLSSHPNIIRLYGVVQPEHGIPYADGRYDGFGLLLEPLSDTLDLRLEDWRRQYSWDQDESCRSSDNEFQLLPDCSHLCTVLNYAAQLADALQYMHERRIVMSDCKPSNVGFTMNDEDRVVIFDLGWCRELPAKDGEIDDPCRLYTLPVAGTPNYLPPEALIQRKYNCLLDVYSWAMVLYEMITLEKPFGGCHAREDYHRLAKKVERPTLDDKVPLALQELLANTWHEDVQHRSTMRQAYQKLNEIREEMGFLSSSSSHYQSNTQRAPRVHHHKRRSSMDSLLHGRQGRGEELCTRHSTALNDHNDNGGALSMSADDFEIYYGANHHHG